MINKSRLRWFRYVERKDDNDWVKWEVEGIKTQAPRYLADLCVPAHSVHGRQQLRSTASGTLLVPRARTATSQRSFAINGP